MDIFIQELNNYIKKKLGFKVDDDVIHFAPVDISEQRCFYCISCVHTNQEKFKKGYWYYKKRHFQRWVRCQECNKTLVFEPYSVWMYKIEGEFLQLDLKNLDENELMALHCIINCKYVTKKFIITVINSLIPELRDLALLVL